MKEFYPKNGRVILHVDMNSFFASVEMAYDPSLKGRPLAIAGDQKQRKGIVVTCSYEARKFGVKTTMPVWEAMKLCPGLIVRKPTFERYRIASKAMFDELRKYSDCVEPVSIDEGYVDISACHEQGTPMQIAESIQRTLLDHLDLPCSIGIAPNKFLAKMASDLQKPLGITILRKRDIPDVLWPLPTIEMHGIGKKTAEKLAALQIHTIGDLAKADKHALRLGLGNRGIDLQDRANGRDSRPVDPSSAQESKSVGHSVTLPHDLSDQEELDSVLQRLSVGVSERLKRKEYLTENVSITIRYQDRTTVTRSKKLPQPIIESGDILIAAKLLFSRHWNGDPVRLLGITGQDLVDEEEEFEQLNLFSYENVAKKEPLYEAIQRIQERYGKSSLMHGQRNGKFRS